VASCAGLGKLVLDRLTSATTSRVPIGSACARNQQVGSFIEGAEGKRTYVVTKADCRPAIDGFSVINPGDDIMRARASKTTGTVDCSA